jgi:hypothetical protein
MVVADGVARGQKFRSSDRDWSRKRTRSSGARVAQREPRDRLAGRFGALDGAADDPPVRGIGPTWPLPDDVTDTVLEARLYASQSPFEFRTLSLLLVFVLVQALEEITNQGCDLVSRFIQCEMSRFQDMDFGLWHIAGISRRARTVKEGSYFPQTTRVGGCTARSHFCHSG